MEHLPEPGRRCAPIQSSARPAVGVSGAHLTKGETEAQEGSDYLNFPVRGGWQPSTGPVPAALIRRGQKDTVTRTSRRGPGTHTSHGPWQPSGRLTAAPCGQSRELQSGHRQPTQSKHFLHTHVGATSAPGAGDTGTLTKALYHREASWEP